MDTSIKCICLCAVEQVVDQSNVLEERLRKHLRDKLENEVQVLQPDVLDSAKDSCKKYNRTTLLHISYVRC